jgi:RimJ/RimL family protein N-acetyltransferase
VKIGRTHDMEAVREIMAHPAIWPHIHDDGVRAPAPSDVDAAYWLMVEDDKPAGVFLLHPHNFATYEIHTCLLPRIWGAGAMEAGRLVLRWMFENTRCLKIITHVPQDNPAALRFARRNGLKDEGVNRASFLKNGVLLDQHMLGITRREWECQQQQ